MTVTGYHSNYIIYYYISSIELLLVSYEIEAPESVNEKQRYQQLKLGLNE